MRLCVIASFTLLSAGCGSTVVSADAAVPTDAIAPDVTTAGDVSPLPDVTTAVDVTTLPDVATALDASRCDPSVLGDAGVDDVGTPSVAYVLELSLRSLGHQCALMSDRSVRCRGSNQSGQLGLGLDDPSLRYTSGPMPVPGLRDVAQVVVNDSSVTCSRHLDGTVRCWGSNEHDAIGVGHDDDEDCGDGAARIPCRSRPTLVPGLSEVVDLAAEGLGYCAVRGDGSVWCWGQAVSLLDGAAPTPQRVTSLSNVVDLEALRVGWILRFQEGSFELRLPSGAPPPIPRGAELVPSVGSDHYCYRLSDSSMRCAGANTYGQLGGGSTTVEILTPAMDPGLCGVRGGTTGNAHTCVVLADRRVSCWGDVFPESPESPSTREPDRCVGVLGEVDCTVSPRVVSGVGGVDRVFASINGTCALRRDHSVWCWGWLSPNEDQSPGPVQW